ncbi:hypothetical protein TIFTF001_006989 [Ficus carica]|uniref:Uncharacterized protein n=1 Tax=Ficus carica TaxID=3494 RepID=A0AA87ZSB6_FICCA|nr:hypothetical protein TIFTF001_006989 [Ficus carica]
MQHVTTACTVKHASPLVAFGLTVLDPAMSSPLLRGLIMLDMYEYSDDIWLCHGKCDVATVFQPALMALKEVQIFMHENQSEIVTIIIEDHVASPKALTKVFDAAGLRNLSLPVSRMPKDGGDWPTVHDMVRRNQHGDDGMNGYCINRTCKEVMDMGHQEPWTLQMAV